MSLVYVYLNAQRFMNPAVLQNPDIRFLPPEETAAQDAAARTPAIARALAFPPPPAGEPAR